MTHKENLWVFDNDGTLYNDFGAGNKFMEILLPYASNLLQIPINTTEVEIARLKKKWATEFSILALAKELRVDFSRMVKDTYLKLDLDQCGICPDTKTINTLGAIQSPKIVFTNNPSEFARYILDYMKMSHLFIDFIGMEETNFHSKPDPRSYRTVETHHPGHERIFFCDDSLKNLETAHQLGWKTFWIKPPKATPDSNRHIILESLSELENHL